MKLPDTIQTHRLPGPDKPLGGGPWQQHHRDENLGVGVIMRSMGAGHFTQEEWYIDCVPNRTWPTLDEMRRDLHGITPGDKLPYPDARVVEPCAQPCAFMCQVNPSQHATHRMTIALGWHPARAITAYLGRSAMATFKKSGASAIVAALK